MVGHYYRFKRGDRVSERIRAWVHHVVLDAGPVVTVRWDQVTTYHKSGRSD